jgi:hypothetical protein
MPLPHRFHPWLRGRVQAALTRMWTIKAAPLQHISPSHLVATLLLQNVRRIWSWVIIDFCAGGGGPTPSIERFINRRLALAQPSMPVQTEPVQFVLTDLHPHPQNWAEAAAASPNIHYEADPVDASAAAADMIARYAAGEDGERKKVLRLFNLAFHHFDDPLAKAILKNTLETSDGFA